MATGANVSIPDQVWQWLTTAANYSGPGGVPRRLAEHAALAGISMAIAAALALPLGVILGHLRRGGLIVTSLANASRAIPVVGVLILLAVGPLGIGRSPAIVALVIFAIPPMLTNAFTGVREVDEDIREAARGMGMNARQVLLQAEVPLALPLIAAGVRLAGVQVWATATLAALVGSGGFGRFIVDGYAIQDYGQVYGGVIYIAATAVLLEVGLASIEGWLRRHSGQSRSVTLPAVLGPPPPQPL
ncbi:MAG: osmoprotectant transport system permease protein [Frankiales bacterium]|jgi:osmoprotectant transport system permease protein|nr:osmoprotectant transport system permease protein [Frankiales bacterium]